MAGEKAPQVNDHRQSDDAPPQYFDTEIPLHVQPDEKKGESDERESPKNILIVGETANGKSTLIRQMGVYACVPDINVKIGYGIAFC